ncbi:ATP-binding protein [Teredinibacter purpureus]|uniref:ATP-binding protein n=1 Tax=Teredinibacter purpureus TaxID=2731756 RepID=UPI0005F7FDA5|nr:ATP-binding protein [Teredinibacter purpureus]
MSNNEWYALNSRCLAVGLEDVRRACYRALSREYEKEIPKQNESFDDAALTRLCVIFRLSPFERQLLLLCAAAQLEGEFGELYGAIVGDPKRHFPTFDLALTLFNGGQWLPFSPQSTIRYWRLLEMNDTQQPNLTPLRINETVLHYITGFASSDSALSALTIPNDFQPELAGGQHLLAEQVAKLITQPTTDALPPLVQLKGNDKQAGIGVVQVAANLANVIVKRLDASLLPHNNVDLEELYIRLEREAILYQSIYVFECEYEPEQKPNLTRALNYLFKRLTAFCLLTGDIPLSLGARDHIKLDVTRPSYHEQQEIWQRLMPDVFSSESSVAALREILDQFDLSADAIQAIARQWTIDAISFADSSEHSEPHEAVEHVLNLCRKQSRAEVSGLAKIIEPVDIQWQNLVLPEEQLTTLRSIIEQVKHRYKVYRQWGFAQGSAYGLGIGVLFSGASGTGKTLAARVIASELKLDIYQIDLSSIVSKYIGETEKNLEKIFTAAEKSGAILLFDEADALFGKRSEVKDSRDRYANMEVSYLLQRIENFSGLAILTSNFRKALDQAFLRRLRFIVQFPFPQIQERILIWENVFPSQLPRKDITFEKLARLEIPGGIIRSIAINAAFHAASGDLLEMHHIRKAAVDEYKKTEKTLVAELVADW